MLDYMRVDVVPGLPAACAPSTAYGRYRKHVKVLVKESHVLICSLAIVSTQGHAITAKCCQTPLASLCRLLNFLPPR
jgi:hypothetical protein